jgi:hypothetical protein
MSDQHTTLSNVMKQARALVFEGDLDGGRAMFRRAAQTIPPAPMDAEMLRRLAHTSIACGDAAYLTAILNCVYDNDPPMSVTVGPPPVWPRARQAIHATARPGKGWSFVLPDNAEGSGGMELMGRRFVATLPVYAACWRAGLATEGHVVLNVADAARFPGLGYCANIDRVGLIPDPDFLVSRGYETFLRHLADHPVAWEDRKKVAFWRGATTGRGDGTEPAWKSLQRVELCRIVNGPDAALFDAGISRIQFPKGDPGGDAIQALGYMRPFVSNLALQSFRYQIDVDGYTSAWSALFTKLATGSPVLKIGSRDAWRQWYYHRLVPWENYVPVEADMSDLVEKTKWLIAHDDDAQRIGAAGRDLALSMTFEHEVHAAAVEMAAWMRRSLGEARS